MLELDVRSGHTFSDGSSIAEKRRGASCQSSLCVHATVVVYARIDGDEADGRCDSCQQQLRTQHIAVYLHTVREDINRISSF